jgi:hypothetical protein
VRPAVNLGGGNGVRTGNCRWRVQGTAGDVDDHRGDAGLGQQGLTTGSDLALSMFQRDKGLQDAGKCRISRDVREAAKRVLLFSTVYDEPP